MWYGFPPQEPARPLHEIPQHRNPPPPQASVVEQQQPVTGNTNAAGRANQSILVNDDDDDDEFGCDDIDEASFAEVEMNATQSFRASHPQSRLSPTKRSPRRRTKISVHSPKESTASSLHGSTQQRTLQGLQRYVVKQIVDGEYANAKGRRCPERILVAEEEKSSRPSAITLRDSWYLTPLSVGIKIHVANRRCQDGSSYSSPPGQHTISDDENSPLLIVHPDHMLSATTVADSFDCSRKAVLQDRIKATGETSKAMVYSKILHEIFQQALSTNRWDDTSLAELAERTVQNYVEGLWELGMADTVLAIEEVRAKMVQISGWASKYMGESPSGSALVSGKRGEQVRTSISKLIAVEEHVWSPRYGLKGNVDATVQTTVVDSPKEPSRKLVAPFEVKTGKPNQSPAHVAQTALYTLLLSDRYDFEVGAGILYYMADSTTMRVASDARELRQMVQQRNRLAFYMYRARHPSRSEEEQTIATHTQEFEASGFPDMQRDPGKCGRCYAQASCFSYHALVENGTAESAGMIDNGKKNHSMIWHEAVGHLQLNAKDATQANQLKHWFVKWDRLLTLEESDLSRLRQELWTMSSAERERVGRCFGNMVLAQDMTVTTSTSNPDGIEGSGGKISRFTYRFARSTMTKKSRLNEGSHLVVGEPVVVSSESGQWALANGYVTATTKHDITVAVDRRLGDARERMDDFTPDRNQALRGIMTVGRREHHPPTVSGPVLYRLDKDEFSNGLALVRNNLVTIMSSHPIHTKLRNHIVCGAAPKFDASFKPPPATASQLADMIEDQRAAINHVLSAEDYALILGMPGTGKTTTIARLIGALLADGKSILLTSFTHTAVDNILLKIRDIAPPNSILRVGAPAKINAQVQEFCRLAATPRATIDDIESAYMNTQIVAAACLGMGHAVFSRRAFDVCIVDEASQITLPTSLGPLLHARKFVLVADHYQLPPLVQDKAALEGGLDISLFRQLSEQHPEAVAALGKQYRMCSEIMSLSNALIYAGALQCGNDVVARKTLQIKDLTALRTFHDPESGSCATPRRRNVCWIEELCDPKHKVVFANTDPAGKPAHETLTSGRDITNEYEATLIAQLVLSLLTIGVLAKKIGVITLYRAQLALLRRLFKTAGITSEVEIDSADRFQGRDKECVILSMVRSNQAGIVGDLLKDWRRVNVALTRARSEMIIFGSRQTLSTNKLLEQFVQLVEKNRWTLELPADAGRCHNFDFSSQAGSTGMTPQGPTPGKRTAVTPSTSPTKRKTTAFSASPTKKVGILQPSASAGNRTPVRKPGKVISARASQKMAGLKSQAAVQILGDIVAEDL